MSKIQLSTFIVKNETILKSNLLSLNLSQFIIGLKKFSGTGV